MATMIYMNNLIRIVSNLLPFGPMDAVAVGVINFKTEYFDCFEVTNSEGVLEVSFEPRIYFDLASLTKPLTNSLAYFLRPDIFSGELELCLNHRGSLPSWGLLPSVGWREQILAYPVREAQTLYSDFSSLRVMLELEKNGLNQKEFCSSVWDEKTVFWTDLPLDAICLQTGFKRSLPNFGEVHDPNAWNLKTFCSHAGLFSPVDGLCRTLLNYQKKTDFIQKVRSDLSTHKNRFSWGWDRIENPESTLAGRGCGQFTFGHLGFTGTSIWIDSDRMLGHVILSNAVKYHWFDKANINDIRRALGEVVWQGS
jgi:CubicO group peptidase (beta-lactamase class C family)